MGSAKLKAMLGNAKQRGELHEEEADSEVDGDGLPPRKKNKRKKGGSGGGGGGGGGGVAAWVVTAGVSDTMPVADLNSKLVLNARLGTKAQKVAVKWKTCGALADERLEVLKKTRLPGVSAAWLLKLAAVLHSHLRGSAASGAVAGGAAGGGAVGGAGAGDGGVCAETTGSGAAGGAPGTAGAQRRRPPGRPPRGKQWDALQGWVDLQLQEPPPQELPPQETPPQEMPQQETPPREMPQQETPQQETPQQEGMQIEPEPGQEAMEVDSMSEEAGGEEHELEVAGEEEGSGEDEESDSEAELGSTLGTDEGSDDDDDSDQEADPDLEETLRLEVSTDRPNRSRRYE